MKLRPQTRGAPSTADSVSRAQWLRVASIWKTSIGRDPCLLWTRSYIWSVAFCSMVLLVCIYPQAEDRYTLGSGYIFSSRIKCRFSEQGVWPTVARPLPPLAMLCLCEWLCLPLLGLQDSISLFCCADHQSCTIDFILKINTRLHKNEAKQIRDLLQNILEEGGFCMY